jgi:hypothetical protein
MVVGGVLYSGFQLYKTNVLASKQTIPVSLTKQSHIKYANANIIKQSSVNHINEAVIKVQNKLNMALISLGLIIFGYLIYTPLLLVSIFPLLYIAIPRFKTAYIALFIEKRLRIDVVDVICFTIGLAKGYYFWITVGACFYYFSEKMLAETEDSSRKNLINVFDEQPRFVWVLVNEMELKHRLSNSKLTMLLLYMPMKLFLLMVS